ncbi:TetR/AcrR family transcriptional regulator C-terminal domain-containing protein [Paenibacillus enshidis]|uniref:TetR/AcrR family transcriptional regulator C-terminal domain-containing protein n=1 Tax=Paenibacillus enshidis TaxID=1458439 RepID=A0ABV5ANI5_9BACL
MNEHEKPRMDPRIIRTRQLLKDALIDLLQEVDVEKISVNRIAERATINRVTFYLHYRDIPDMLEKMADDMVKDIQHVMNHELPMDNNSVEEIKFLRLLSLLEHISGNSKFYKIILGSRRIPIFTERLLLLLTEMISLSIHNSGNDSMISKSGVPKDIAIWHYSSALIGTIIGWLKNDMPYTPHFLAKQILVLLGHHRLP